MATPTCHPLGAHDSLSRDHLLHVADAGGGLATTIAIGALLGLLLAIAGSLDPKRQESADRRALTGAPTEIVAIPQSPWGEAPRGEDQLSH
jgi:hypothetical protein